MIPASYLMKDTLRQSWGRDFARNPSEAIGPVRPAIRTARALFNLAFGPRRGR